MPSGEQGAVFCYEGDRQWASISRSPDNRSGLHVFRMRPGSIESNFLHLLTVLWYTIQYTTNELCTIETGG